MIKILEANTEEAINACFPVFKELRPHLSAQTFLEQVVRQKNNHGYQLVYIENQHTVVAAAGYRVAEFLAWGRTFYVDDLITSSAARKQGYGGALLDWLIEQSKALQCDQFHLDSGVQRFDAHRLYMSRNMQISSHHFSRRVD